MNYVILNGKKSNTVNGLLIQSLPPISKPLMRTEIEEIDGRDGDIVTPLGYSAYDKTISIGLHGNYDVNEAIRFFESEGTVIFSNEPDKFYKYKIIEQIDFERLIRFRTAEVVFHVQPFKYSAVDMASELVNQSFSVKPYSETKNGLTVTASDGKITVSGTATRATEFNIPVTLLELDTGSYGFRAIVEGTGANNCSARLINNAPTNADSFGGSYLPLRDNGSASLSADLTGSKSYNLIWLYVAANKPMDYSAEFSVLNSGSDSMVILNRGNTISRPLITISGTHPVILYINGVQVFTIGLGINDWITIDSSRMEAYQENTLRNRSVLGNYDDLVLQSGRNVISWIGNVKDIIVENYSRWI